ncbi:hypothetical protein ASPZODRAFT_127866 [Penicilliopsis zonata CBS 506.65]|uniref:MARVEL domain-containing protein n=1 Tax=Penicilliopsis zonata CBS 506.65 TaxID=1073090 RepID=A0A1L9SX36_9EURO|nr:hypothetical protein ASPZODRAFT_127866 [Penicilliopsis zonata CBS 506.65]OJJ51740.1 hypothetical protein ASPZODRAFT_127866 [Penicilliopsis zonata CBS 506.65]
MLSARYGALGATFQISRLFQVCSLIAIIGMTANFISEIIGDDLTPPSVLIGTISVTSIAAIYCIISTILFMDNILPFLLGAITDGLVLIAVIVVAVVVGKPVSYLECNVIGDLTGDSTSAYDFTVTLENALNEAGGRIKYSDWIGASKAICLETKAIWGLTIALCILFFFSTICSVCLWRQKKLNSGEKLEG